MRLYEEKGVRVSIQEAVDAAQVFRSFSLRYVRLYYGAKELLAHLKKKDKKLYVLSNAQQVFTASELRYLGIYDYFDKVCLSSDYHCKKPDAAWDFHAKAALPHHESMHHISSEAPMSHTLLLCRHNILP